MPSDDPEPDEIDGLTSQGLRPKLKGVRVEEGMKDDILLAYQTVFGHPPKIETLAPDRLLIEGSVHVHPSRVPVYRFGGKGDSVNGYLVITPDADEKGFTTAQEAISCVIATLAGERAKQALRDQEMARAYGQE